MAEFSRILPEVVRFLPQSFTDYLYSAVNKSPTSDLTVEDAISYAESGVGEIFSVKIDGKTVGAALFLYGNSPKGTIMDVALLGGEQFQRWRDEIYEFAKKHAKTMGCNRVWVMGRKGWGKVFPEMKQIGVIYELEIE